MSENFYCMKCHKNIKTEPERIGTEGRKRVAHSHCPTCGTKVRKYVSADAY